MKNKIGLLGVLAALLLAPVLTTGCPDKGSGEKKSKATELTAITVGEANVRVVKAWSAVSANDYLEWLDGEYDIAE